MWEKKQKKKNKQKQKNVPIKPQIVLCSVDQINYEVTFLKASLLDINRCSHK